MHLAGFTDRLLAPSEQWSLLDRGIGITNLVATTSRAARDLTAEQLRQGAVDLEAKVAELRPAFVAVLGMEAYRVAFRRPRATVGGQPDLLCGARLWLSPTPAGCRPGTACPTWWSCSRRCGRPPESREPAGARPGDPTAGRTRTTRSHVVSFNGQGRREAARAIESATRTRRFLATP